MLDPENFPQLAVFVPGYLHQDLDVFGGIDGAVCAWRDDTSHEVTRLLAGEWLIFLEMTRDLDAGARGRLLEASFGGAWAPRSDEELHTLTRALTPDV